MKTIHRYILKECLPTILLSVLLLSLLFMVNKVFLCLELVLAKKAPLAESLLLYLSLVPFILSLTMPMSMMVGTLLAFGRLSSDMEVTAFKSGGGHPFHLIAPILLLGAAMTLVMFLFTDKVVPASKYLFKRTEYGLVKKKADLTIQERVFVDQFEGHQFYIDRRLPDGSFSGIRVLEHWSPGPMVQTTLASTGRLVTDPRTLQVYLHLDKGVMTWDNRNFQTLNRLFFDQYTIRLNLGTPLSELSDIKKDYEEMSLKEIAKAIPSEKDPGRLDHLRTEYQKRLALPFACLVLPWLCAPLGLWLRSKGFMGFVLGLSLIFLYYLMFIFGETLSDEGRISPILGLWGANGVLGLGGFLVYFLALAERPFRAHRLLVLPRSEGAP